MLRIGLNGFGRIGRSLFRLLAPHVPLIQIRQINEPAGDADALAHLLKYDTTHGISALPLRVDAGQLFLAESAIGHSRHRQWQAGDWRDCDIVIDCSGTLRDAALARAAKAEIGAPRLFITNLVEPVVEDNHPVVIPHDIAGYHAPEHGLASAPILATGSCTAHCLYPLLKWFDEHYGLRRGLMTSIHRVTRSQSLVDTIGGDLRRMRAAHESIVPTHSGSIRALPWLYPEMAGRVGGHCVRVPHAVASLCDLNLELQRDTSRESLNRALEQACREELRGIIGFERAPLVSCDYRGNPYSGTLDSLLTQVIDKRLVKIAAWYDNEWGYASRVAERLIYLTGTKHSGGMDSLDNIAR